MAAQRTVRLKTHERRELEYYRDHDARPYVRERCVRITIKAGAWWCKKIHSLHTVRRTQLSLMRAGPTLP